MESWRGDGETGVLPTVEVWRDIAEMVTKPPRAAIRPLPIQPGALPVTPLRRDNPVECSVSFQMPTVCVLGDSGNKAGTRAENIVPEWDSHMGRADAGSAREQSRRCQGAPA